MLEHPGVAYLTSEGSLELNIMVYFHGESREADIFEYESTLRDDLSTLLVSGAHSDATIEGVDGESGPYSRYAHNSTFD